MEEETFKVTDRRGRARDEAAAEPAVIEPAPQPRSAAPERPAASPSGPAAQAAYGQPGSVELQDVFWMFANSALVNLGAAPDPASGEQSLDLEQAREAIDVLVLLRDKTAAHRTDEESQLLEQLVYELQMRFVQATGNESPLS